jgi:hypothetical protein
MLDVLLRRFEKPDESRRFEKGCFDIVRLGGIEIGRATYEPGWKWSIHVAPSVGTALCPVEHVGLVLSGVATVPPGRKDVELRPGICFTYPPFPTTVGSSDPSATSPCISWGRPSTPRSE